MVTLNTRMLGLSLYDEATGKSKPLTQIVDAVKLKEWLAEGDGHTIFDPAFFTEVGFSKEFVAQFEATHGEGATDPKSAVFDGEGRQVVTTGVYGLSVLRHVASQYGITSTKLGRGSEARELGEKLIKRLRLQRIRIK